MLLMFFKFWLNKYIVQIYYPLFEAKDPISLFRDK